MDQNIEEISLSVPVTPSVQTAVSNTTTIVTTPKTRSPRESFHASESPVLPSKLAKKHSLKLQKQTYKVEKKKAENEFQMTVNDSAVILLSDWLKVRSTLKNWSRMWCVLKPGVLVLYKNSKEKTWVGTVVLTSSEIIERPSKKDGFCFKIYNALNQTIWTTKGPKGESLGVLSSSLPTSYLILRAQGESDGRCWLDALELSRKCTNLLKKSTEASSKVAKSKLEDNSEVFLPGRSVSLSLGEQTEPNKVLDDSYIDLMDLQQKLSLLGHNQQSIMQENNIDCASPQQNNNSQSLMPPTSLAILSNNQDSGDESSAPDSVDSYQDIDAEIKNADDQETKYVADKGEEFGDTGENSQTEVLAGESKSLVWSLLKQLRPGMDLSKVVLPTFILEPRSFLDKLSDYYYHADLLSSSAIEENPYNRIKGITKWYLSGFYKKPKGLKKPYNPILGETFRCMWDHPETNSSTFYLAEQVSHHPPVSAFVVINRKDGFTVDGSILAKSKFYGNSISAVLEGTAKVSLLKHGEEYTFTMPYAHCKGIIYGKMTMEFGGKVCIQCEKTGYSAELEFKLKPLFGGGKLNEVSGRISLGKRVLATLSGYWDEEVFLTDLSGGTVSRFWSPTEEVRKSRLKRYVVPLEQQVEFESEGLWRKVSSAIDKQDQVLATDEKYVLEDAQRKGAKKRKEEGVEWLTKHFQYDDKGEQWVYNHIDARPWDELNDIVQYEKDGKITTRTKHCTSPVKTGLLQNVSRENATASSSFRSTLSEASEPGGRLNRKIKSTMHISSLEMTTAISELLIPIAQNQKEILACLEKLKQQMQLVAVNGRDNHSLPWNTILICFFMSLVLYFLIGYRIN
ncbi:oxysterol-binding protein-related protein 8 [Ciona intestinalis]